MHTTCLILAAGRSRRMGTPKAWLRWRGTTLLQHIVSTASASEVDRIVVVTGSLDNETLTCSRDVENAVGHRWKGCPVQTTVGRPDRHPIDSVRAGLAAAPDPGNLLLWPVDCPFAPPDLVVRLFEALDNQPDRIAVPAVGGRLAHPVLLGARVVPELSGASADRGAREIVRRDPARLLTVDSDDRRLIHDLNTPAEATALSIQLPAHASGCVAPRANPTSTATMPAGRDGKG